LAPTDRLKIGNKLKIKKIIVLRDDGSESIISNSSIPIRNEKGKIIMGISIFSDISDAEF